MAYRRTPAVEARLERTREAILRAARRIIATHGLRGLSIAAVAAGADVSVGTVYRYFESKDGLLRAVVDDVCTREIAVVAKVATEPVGNTDRLVGAVATFARRAVASGRVAYAVIAEPAPPEVEHHRIGHRRDLATVFAGVIADGVAAGDFPPQSADVAATAIVGAVSEVIVGPLSPTAGGDTPNEHEIDRVLDEIVTHVHRAVTGRSPARSIHQERS